MITEPPIEPAGGVRRPAAEPGSDTADRRFVRRGSGWLGAIAVLLTFGVLTEAKLWRPDVRFGIRENVQIGEAQAWWSGRLDLPERLWDTALKDGRVYSYFPPMFTILAAGVVPFFNGVPHALIVVLVAAVPICAYLLFWQLTRSAAWGAVLSIGLVCGSSVFPVLDKTLRGASPYNVNHTLATMGLLLFLIDYFGRKRVWPAAIGLGIATLSRQLTFVYALPLCAMAWWGGPSSRRVGRTAPAVIACVLIAGIYGGLNTLKFGHPLHTGYMLNHEGRDDIFAREARAHGLLSTTWVPRNLYYTNLGPPDLHLVEIEGRNELYLRPNTMGTGIWWTTPLLLWVFFDARKVWRDRSTAVLLVAAVLLFGMLMFWHATGSNQRGFNRYSLDYLPAILALIAPRCIMPGRRWITLGMIVWSVLYFVAVLPQPNIRVW